VPPKSVFGGGPPGELGAGADDAGAPGVGATVVVPPAGAFVEEAGDDGTLVLVTIVVDVTVVGLVVPPPEQPAANNPTVIAAAIVNIFIEAPFEWHFDVRPVGLSRCQARST
jgi:hypothetical protein